MNNQDNQQNKDESSRCAGANGSAPFRADYLPPGSEAVITKDMHSAGGVYYFVGDRVTIIGADYRRGTRDIKRVDPIGDQRDLNELNSVDVQNLSLPNVKGETCGRQAR